MEPLIVCSPSGFLPWFGALLQKIIPWFQFTVTNTEIALNECDVLFGGWGGVRVVFIYLMVGNDLWGGRVAKIHEVNMGTLGVYCAGISNRIIMRCDFIFGIKMTQTLSGFIIQRGIKIFT